MRISTYQTVTKFEIFKKDQVQDQLFVFQWLLSLMSCSNGPQRITGRLTLPLTDQATRLSVTAFIKSKHREEMAPH